MDTVTTKSTGSGGPGHGVSIETLDFLRGFAAIYVVINHARGSLFSGGQALAADRPLQLFDYFNLGLLQATSLGTEAVSLFFVLSGFAMAHSVRHSKSVRDFYIKRVIRIWPPYLVAVALAVALCLIMMMMDPTNPLSEACRTDVCNFRDLGAMIFYIDVETHMTGQFWSLPHEVLFYLLCPFLLVSLRRINLFWGLSAAMLAGGLVVFGLRDDFTEGFTITFLTYALFFFMTGAGVYYYSDHVPRVSSRTLLIIVAVMTPLIWYTKYILIGHWNTFSSLLVIPVAVMLMFNLPQAIARNRWLNWGEYSYSIYVYHLQVIAFIGFLIAFTTGRGQSELTSYWAWTLAVPPALAVAWLLWLVSERQCNSYLRGLRARENARMASQRQHA